MGISAGVCATLCQNILPFFDLSPLSFQMAKAVSKRKAKPTKSSKKKGKRKKKDPNAPKRPMSAYFFFMAEQREKVKAENPSAGVAQIGKISGEKTKYEEMNRKDKIRYEKEMAKYKQSSSSEE